MDQDATWYEGMGIGLRDIVLDGDPASPPLKGYSPQFSANVRCGQAAGWTKMPLGMEVGLWGPSYPQKKGTPTPSNFWAVYCSQTAGWMKTPLGTEVDLGPGHIVLDRVP